MVQLLLAQSSVDVNARDDEGLTPVMIADEGHPEAIQLLLDYEPLW